MQTALKLLVLTGLAFAPALAGCLAIDPDFVTFEVGYEASEDARLELEGLGQRNCVEVALQSRATARCPSETTTVAFPTTGIRILDSVYVVPAPGQATTDLEGVTRDDGSSSWAVYKSLFVGANPRRASGGLLTDTILPGYGTFVAALGLWNNEDSDENIQVRRAPGPGAPIPGNEWDAIKNARLYSYVDPGAHPTYATVARPEAYSPDFTYVSAGSYYRAASATDGSSDFIVFTDGSLFTVHTVMTVSDPILAPQTDGKLPFTPSPTSLVDVDRYVTSAPGSVSGIYAATAENLVEGLGSPNYGWCPNGCRIEPVRARGTPIDETLELQSAFWGRYLPEWRPDAESSAAGRREAFNETYTGWLDLLPRTQQPTYGFNLLGASPLLQQSHALFGGTRGGEAAAAPSFVTFEMWSGIWFDISRDGHVGVPAAPDPYEGGTRPLADDYYNPRGEFFGTRIDKTESVVSKVHVRVTPDDLWAPGTTKVMWTTNSAQPSDCPGTQPGNVRVCSVRPVTGMDPVLLNVTADAATLGRHYSAQAILLPPGSPGFTMCAGPFEVKHDTPGYSVTEQVWDCDHVAAWTMERPPT